MGDNEAAKRPVNPGNAPLGNRSLPSEKIIGSMPKDSHYCGMPIIPSK